MKLFPKLPCPACGHNLAGDDGCSLSLHLDCDDYDLICVECEAEITLDEIRSAAEQFTKLVKWIEQIKEVS